MTDKLYQLILGKVPLPPPETGGILGGKCGIITHCRFDSGRNRSAAPAHYHPNISFLNQVIQQWQVHDISFLGLFHSHYSNDTELSLSDKRYIAEIMNAMPTAIHTLYFPIVLPGKEIIGYRADKYRSRINIVYDKIEILQNGG